MKTNIDPHAVHSHSPQVTTVSVIHSGIGRLLLAVVCASLVSFTSVTTAVAGPDGEYAFVSASGSLTAGGDTYELPQDLLKEIGAIQKGKIVIQDNKIQLNRKAAAKIIQQLGDQLGIVFDITISGPTSLKLKKSGKIYVGSTTTPVVVAFETTYNGTKISGYLKTYFNATVKGDVLTLKVPVGGKALGMKFTGDMTIKAKR
jgi:hypothetical protein